MNSLLLAELGAKYLLPRSQPWLLAVFGAGLSTDAPARRTEEVQVVSTAGRPSFVRDVGVRGACVSLQSARR